MVVPESLFFLWCGYENCLPPATPAVAARDHFPVGNDLPSFPFLSFTVGTATLTIMMWASMFSPETVGSLHNFSTPTHCRESRSESQTRARLLPEVKPSREDGGETGKLENPCGWDLCFSYSGQLLSDRGWAWSYQRFWFFEGKKKKNLNKTGF